MHAATISKRGHVFETEKGGLHGGLGERNDIILISKMREK